MIAHETQRGRTTGTVADLLCPDGMGKDCAPDNVTSGTPDGGPTGLVDRWHRRHYCVSDLLNFSGGFVVDDSGHIGTYNTVRAGLGMDAKASGGISLSFSNAQTISDLSGPFSSGNPGGGWQAHLVITSAAPMIMAGLLVED